MGVLIHANLPSLPRYCFEEGGKEVQDIQLVYGDSHSDSSATW